MSVKSFDHFIVECLENLYNHELCCQLVICFITLTFEDPTGANIVRLILHSDKGKISSLSNLLADLFLLREGPATQFFTPQKKRKKKKSAVGIFVREN